MEKKLSIQEVRRIIQGIAENEDELADLGHLYENYQVQNPKELESFRSGIKYLYDEIDIYFYIEQNGKTTEE